MVLVPLILFIWAFGSSLSVTGNPKVSIVIPNKTVTIYKQCLNSILDKTSFANFEIILVDSGSTDKKLLELYKSRLITSNNIKIVPYIDKEFNFSKACNLGAEHSTGNYLLFLNNDTEVIASDWIESMLEHAQRNNIGMVGAKLFFPDDSIQHAGIVLSQRDIAFHPFYGLNPKHDIFSNIYIANIRNCAAVTAACSMVSKEKFDQVGGFDEGLRITYNDVDLCLRLLKAGTAISIHHIPNFYHYEASSVGEFPPTKDKKQNCNSNLNYAPPVGAKLRQRIRFITIPPANGSRVKTYS